MIKQDEKKIVQVLSNIFTRSLVRVELEFGEHDFISASKPEKSNPTKPQNSTQYILYLCRRREAI